MTVRAEEVQMGDLIVPKGDGGGGKFRRVVEVKRYSDPGDVVSSVVLIVVPVGRHHIGIYLPGDLVSIQRRERPSGSAI
jgi:hypothetical protein